MMSDPVNPAFVLFGAALLLLVLPTALRSFAVILGPLIASTMLYQMEPGTYGLLQFAQMDLETLRYDALSRPFALVFVLASLMGGIYMFHVKDRVQQAAGLAYAGSALGAVLAGDWITLFIYWEGTALASVFLIWARRTEGAYFTGQRYLLIQVSSGVILLAGVALLWRDTGSLAFNALELGGLASWLIFLAIGIKCAFPLLNFWLQDAYPASTIAGGVLLSAFTTKLAIYTLARAFPGTDILVWIGCIMAVYPLIFAFVENDIRRVLTWSIVNQQGIMVAGVGIGSQLALNGVLAHAFSSVIYSSLLFMAAGAVIMRSGTSRLSDLAGIGRTMPRTALLFMVGALSIGSAPLLSGFVSKAMTLDAVYDAGLTLPWLLLYVGSAGAFVFVTLRVGVGVFYSRPRHESGPVGAPASMLFAMGLAALACFAIGVAPDLFYNLLPFEVEYEPFTLYHVVGQLQIMAFGALAWFLMLYAGLVNTPRPGIVLDLDWTYRRVFRRWLATGQLISTALWNAAAWFVNRRMDRIVSGLQSSHGPEGRMARTFPTGSMVIWVAIILGAVLLVSFVNVLA